MTLLDVLEAIKLRLEEKVAPMIELPNPNPLQTEKPYVNPKVYLGHIPPEDDDPETHTLPGIVVGFGESVDDGEQATTIPILISFILYRDVDDGIDPNSFDMSGYKELAVVIEKTKQSFSTNRLIEDSMKKGVCQVQAPFKFGPFKEQKYPYWYAYLHFNVTTAPSEQDLSEYI